MKIVISVRLRKMSMITSRVKLRHTEENINYPNELTQIQLEVLRHVREALYRIKEVQREYKILSEDASKVANREVDHHFNTLGELQYVRGIEQRLCSAKTQFDTAMSLVEFAFPDEKSRELVAKWFIFPEEDD